MRIHVCVRVCAALDTISRACSASDCFLSPRLNAFAAKILPNNVPTENVWGGDSLPSVCSVAVCHFTYCHSHIEIKACNFERRNPRLEKEGGNAFISRVVDFFPVLNKVLRTVGRYVFVLFPAPWRRLALSFQSSTSCPSRVNLF
uniref:Uncharacterized protein n=1 Tax=Meleagris gallopavo TaxID=9103 RepID=A0A803XUC6_MELGA